MGRLLGLRGGGRGWRAGGATPPLVRFTAFAVGPRQRPTYPGLAVVAILTLRPGGVRAFSCCGDPPRLSPAARASPWLFGAEAGAGEQRVWTVQIRSTYGQHFAVGATRSLVTPTMPEP